MTTTTFGGLCGEAREGYCYYGGGKREGATTRVPVVWRRQAEESVGAGRRDRRAVRGQRQRKAARQEEGARNEEGAGRRWRQSQEKKYRKRKEPTKKQKSGRSDEDEAIGCWRRSKCKIPSGYRGLVQYSRHSQQRPQVPCGSPLVRVPSSVARRTFLSTLPDQSRPLGFFGSFSPLGLGRRCRGKSTPES